MENNKLIWEDELNYDYSLVTHKTENKIIAYSKMNCFCDTVSGFRSFSTAILII